MGVSYQKPIIKEIVKKAAAEFVSLESDRTSLITVTDVSFSKDYKNAAISVTVFPQENEEKALSFLKRKRKDFKDFVKKNTKLQIIPFFDFEIDKGEKARQSIDELLR